MFWMLLVVRNRPQAFIRFRRRIQAERRETTTATSTKIITTRSRSALVSCVRARACAVIGWQTMQNAPDEYGRIGRPFQSFVDEPHRMRLSALAFCTVRVVDRRQGQQTSPGQGTRTTSSTLETNLSCNFFCADFRPPLQRIAVAMASEAPSSPHVAHFREFFTQFYFRLLANAPSLIASRVFTFSFAFAPFRCAPKNQPTRDCNN